MKMPNENKTKAPKAVKKFYPKNDVLFEGKVKIKIKNKKEVTSVVTENVVNFKEGKVVFKKDVAVSKEDLALMTNFQKKHYLDEK